MSCMQTTSKPVQNHQRLRSYGRPLHDETYLIQARDEYVFCSQHTYLLFIALLTSQTHYPEHHSDKSDGSSSAWPLRHGR